MQTVYARVNTILLTMTLLVGIAILALIATRTTAGPLDPPGPVASTDGVREPGVPITSLPFTITQSGRYYVTRNLTGAPGGSGVIVDANDVTLDLMGFTLAGAGSGSGIVVVPSRAGITVKNGTVSNWDLGILASGTGYVTITGITARSNDLGGIDIGAHGRVSDCMVASNGLQAAPDEGFGIRVAFSLVERCVIADNAAGAGIRVLNQSRISGNFLRNNYTYGILASGAANMIDANYSCANSGTFSDITIGIAIAPSQGNVVLGNVLGESGHATGGTGKYLPYHSVATPEPNTSADGVNVHVAPSC